MRLILMIGVSLLVGQPAWADDHDHHHQGKQAPKRESAHEHNHGKSDKTPKRESHHRRHKAHDHGKVNLSLAIDGKKAKLTWNSPAESVYGFEHTPKTDADKKRQEDGLNKLETEFFNMFTFDGLAACELRKSNSTVEAEDVKTEEQGHKHHSTHAEVTADFELECTKDLTGTELKINIAKVFSNVKAAKFSYISGSKQAAKDLPQGKGSVKL